MYMLPKSATAPFCPPEVKGTVPVYAGASFWKRLRTFAGPGLLVSVGYMDPGNWATDIEAGSKYGYDLLYAVALSSLAAMLLQWLAMKLGIVTGKDLAQLSKQRNGRAVNLFLWAMAEISIIACDLAEVLGGALAFHLLLGVPLLAGVALTALDTFIVLGLQGQKFRQLEAIVLGLVATIGLAYVAELWLIKPYWPDVARGLLPDPHSVFQREPLYLAIGILGATVMPHNLYLHSSIVQTRRVAPTEPARREAIAFLGTDTVVSLVLAMLINAAILVVAGAAFHYHGHNDVADIGDAYHLLDPIVGGSIAGILFGVGLLASGQNSTLTGTIAGQVVMEGYLDLYIPCWQRRLITRGVALVPAFIGIAFMGEHALGKLLVGSQVVLSLQLPFVLFPLTRLTGNKEVMGVFTNSALTKVVAWGLFLVITAANVVLLADMVNG
jgi:manganese transport protein